jgi:hypothetical protein
MRRKHGTIFTNRAQSTKENIVIYRRIITNYKVLRWVKSTPKERKTPLKQVYAMMTGMATETDIQAKKWKHCQNF